MVCLDPTDLVMFLPIFVTDHHHQKFPLPLTLLHRKLTMDQVMVDHLVVDHVGVLLLEIMVYHLVGAQEDMVLVVARAVAGIIEQEGGTVEGSVK
jgi:hypothetical protein